MMKIFLHSRTTLGKTFKAQFLFLLMLLSSIGVWGQTLYEDFNYAAGQNIGGNANSVGGPVNNWITHNNSNVGEISVTFGSLSYIGLQNSTGNKVRLPGDNTNVPRDVNTPISGTGAHVAYFSVLINVIDNTQLKTGDDYLMNFGTTSNTNTSGFGGRLGIKSVNSGTNYRFSIQNTSLGTPTFTEFAQDLVFGTTYLVVVKYDKSTSPTVASLWVNPSSLGGAEPSGAVINSSGTGLFAAFASICLRNTANTPKADIDEIRVGTTWASVTPAPSCIAPTLNSIPTALQNITSDVDLTGNITALGGAANITKRGFELSKSSTMTSQLDLLETSGAPYSTGAYNLNSVPDLSLEGNTKYYFRSYAVSDCATPQTGYSSAAPVATNFVTRQFSTSTNAATLVSSTSFRANWIAPASGTETFTYKLFVAQETSPSSGTFGTYTEYSSIPSTNAYYDVSALTPNTKYRYYFKSTNSAGDSFLPSASTDVTTLANETIEFGNLQFPQSTSIPEAGTTELIYAKAYQPGVTPPEGDPVIIKAWIGISPEGAPANSIPNTWTKWIPAPWFNQVVNDDQFATTINTATENLTLGTYRYASRFQINSGSYSYGGYNGGFWDGTTNGSGTLTVNSKVVGYANVQSPFTGTITQGGSFDVYARVYKEFFTEAAGSNANISSWIGYSTTNATAEANFTDPSWTWVPATFNAQYGNDDEYVANIGSALPAGVFYYVSRFRVTGSTEYKYGGTNNNFWTAPANSGVLNVYTAPAITSILTKSTVYGAADTYTITATGSTPLTFGAIGLPAGLSLNTSTGLISGTATGNVAIYNVTISATNRGGTDSKTLVWTITKKPLTITGLTGVNKIYDGTSSATLSGTPVLNTVVSGDDVSVAGTPTASFASKIVGTAKPITVTGYTLSGTKAGNYTVSQPTGLTENITAKALAISGATAQNKIYDGATAAIITGAALVGVISPDAVTVSGGGTFADANAGIGKAVTAALSLSGGDATNYTLTQPTGLIADITKANPVFTISPIFVLVGGNYTLPGANITSTSNGTLSFTMTDNAAASLNGGNTINGLAVGSNTLTVNQAASANCNAGSTTVGVNVATVVYVDGDYWTINNGNWHSTTSSGSTNTWQQLISGVWTTIPNSPPTNSASLGTKKVYVRHVIGLVGTNTAPNVIVESGGILNTSTVQATFGNLFIKGGATFNRESNGSGVSGIFEVFDNGTVTFRHTDTTSRSSTIWAGTEKFHANSNFEVLTVDNVVMRVVQNASDVSTFLDPITGTTACFGNIVINCSGGKMNFVYDGFNSQLTHKNLIFRKNSDTTPFSEGAITTTIGGNLIVENTYDQANLTFGSGTVDVAVNGNVLHQDNTSVRLSTSLATDTKLNVQGDIILNGGGAFNVNTGSGPISGSSTINLKGDLSVAAGNSFLSTATGNNYFNFIGSGDGLSPASTQTIDVGSSTTLSNINFNVNNGSYTRLINQDLSLGTNSTFNVLKGGTLDFGFNGVYDPITNLSAGASALNLVSNGKLQTFTASTGSTLKITSSAGINSTGSSALGNVQTPLAGRTFDAGTIYHYIGKANQSTGNGLPGGLTNKVIVDLQTDATNENLNLNVDGIVKINSTGILEIRRGKVIDVPFNGFRNNIAVENEDGEFDAQKGNILMTGGRYVVSGSGIKPSLSGAYNLEAGTVEFAGSAATKIRTSSSPVKQYFNIDISGTNVETGGKSLVVNQVTTVSNTGILRIRETADNLASPNVITSKRGVTIVGNGKLNLENNAQLMQDANAVNVGNINVQRIAKVRNSTFNQYVYWSSPVDTQNFRGIFPGQTTTALYYNESNDKFYTSSGAYIAGRGLAVRNPSTSPGFLTAEFKGTPFVGNLNYSLAWSNSERGYNLVGNPYPSNLDLNKLFANSTNIEAKFQFWDNTSNTEQSQLGSGYMGYSHAIYNPAAGNMGSGNPAPGSVTEAAGTKAPNRLLKIGQGFITRATALNARLSFKNEDRVTDQNAATFFGKSAVDSTNNRYWLEMLTPANLRFSNAIVYFDSGTNEFSIDDTKMESVVSDALFTNADEERVVINGRSRFVDTDVLQVGSRHFTTGLYEIRVGSKEGIFSSGQNIYLKDKQTGIITNLSEGSYKFIAIAGESTGRFVVIYQPEVVLVTDNKIKEGIIIYRVSDDFIIKSPQVIAMVELYDLSGKLITMIEANNRQVVVDGRYCGTGMYVLRIKLDNGTIINKKVIK